MEGYTDHRRHIIVTETDLEPAARLLVLLVLLHESAHALLHPDAAEYVVRRGVCETETVSIAYLLAGLPRSCWPLSAVQRPGLGRARPAYLAPTLGGAVLAVVDVEHHRLPNRASRVSSRHSGARREQPNPGTVSLSHACASSLTYPANV